QVQVSVSWDAESDVDLHVVDPSGAEVSTTIPLLRQAAYSTWTQTPSVTSTTRTTRTSPGALPQKARTSSGWITGTAVVPPKPTTSSRFTWRVGRLRSSPAT